MTAPPRSLKDIKEEEMLRNPCQKCGTAAPLEDWGGTHDAVSLARNPQLIQRWCRKCVLIAQVAYMQPIVEKFPKVKQELDALLAVEGRDEKIQTDSSCGASLMSIRERIIAVGDKQFDAHNEYDAGVSAISLAAAREALLIAKERIEARYQELRYEFDVSVTKSQLDSLLAELSDGQTAKPEPEIR